MYNDTIKATNKIISYDDLYEIFSMLNEKLNYFLRINDQEKKRNEVLDYDQRSWTFRDNGSHVKFEIDFYDATTVTFDNFNNFITIFNNRTEEIKNMYVFYVLSYSYTNSRGEAEHHTQRINMFIYEDKFEIEVSLSSEDRRLDDAYEFIKSKILNAPSRYDEVIKKKSSITTKVSLAIGLIPAMVIMTLLLIIGEFRHTLAITYVGYPLLTLVLALFIGGVAASLKLEGLYKDIMPDKKYAGYDSYSNKSVYKDDIDSFVAKSEVLFGKNTDNLKKRNAIRRIRDKYQPYLLYEYAILALLSLIVIFLR